MLSITINPFPTLPAPSSIPLRAVEAEGRINNTMSSRRTVPISPAAVLSDEERDGLIRAQNARNRGGPPRGVSPRRSWGNPYIPQRKSDRTIPFPTELVDEDGKPLEPLTPEEYAFVLEMLKNGGNATKAYCVAYPGKVRRNEEGKVLSWVGLDACAVVRRPSVSKHLKAAREMLFAQQVAGTVERQAILSGLARANALDFVEVGADGTPKYNLDPEHPNAMAIRGVTFDESYDRNGILINRKTGFTLADPVRAIDTLNRMEGLYKDEGGGEGRVPVQVVINLGDQEKSF
jgi:hypothetical protein